MLNFILFLFSYKPITARLTYIRSSGYKVGYVCKILLICTSLK